MSEYDLWYDANLVAWRGRDKVSWFFELGDYYLTDEQLHYVVSNPTIASLEFGEVADITMEFITRHNIEEYRNWRTGAFTKLPIIGGGDV